MRRRVRLTADLIGAHKRRAASAGPRVRSRPGTCRSIASLSSRWNSGRTPTVL